MFLQGSTLQVVSQKFNINNVIYTLEVCQEFSTIQSVHVYPDMFFLITFTITA